MEIQEQINSVNSKEFDRLLEVWYTASINGAMYWQMCQDHKLKLPSSFITGLDSMREQLNTGDVETIKAVLSSQSLALGLYLESHPDKSMIMSMNTSTGAHVLDDYINTNPLTNSDILENKSNEKE